MVPCNNLHTQFFIKFFKFLQQLLYNFLIFNLCRINFLQCAALRLCHAHLFLFFRITLLYKIVEDFAEFFHLFFMMNIYVRSSQRWGRWGVLPVDKLFGNSFEGWAAECVRFSVLVFTRNPTSAPLRRESSVSWVYIYFRALWECDHFSLLLSSFFHVNFFVSNSCWMEK